MFVRWAIAMLVAAIAIQADGQQKDAEMDLPVFGGFAIRFVSPPNGQVVWAGDSVEVALAVDDSLELAFASVVYAGGMLMLEPPFRGKLPIQAKWIGPVRLHAIGKTDTGALVTSRRDVTLNVQLRNTELIDIEPFEDPLEMWGPGSLKSITIFGEYSDGVRRDVTYYQTSYTIVAGSDVACIMPDAVVVARSPGSATVIVKHKGLVDTLHITVMTDERRRNNPPQAVLDSQYEGTVGERICLNGAKCLDYDECFGEGLEDHSFTWELSYKDTTLEAVGFEFCFTPEEAWIGIVKLKVTDVHADSSETWATIVIE